MKRFDRLIGTLLYLQSRKVTRARDIAAHFHVSIRTVYRDLRSLEEAGVPLAAEAGDGFRLVDGYSLPPVMFSTEEAIALITGIRLAAGLSGTTISHHASTAENKILSILQPESRDAMNNLSRSLEIISPDSPFFQESGPLLSTIQQAVIQRNPMEIRYQSFPKNQTTDRVIEPLGIFYFSGNWHVVAWCRLRTDFRNFRLDRIRQFSVLPEIFAERKEFNLKEFIETQSEATGSVEFTIVTDKRTVALIRQRFGVGITNIGEQNGLSTISYLTYSLEWVPRWLFGFGNRVRVVSPPELVDRIRDELVILGHHFGL